MLTGELFRYNQERGFGFIRCPSRGENFYVHISKAEGNLRNILLGQVDTQFVVWDGFYDPPIPVMFVDGGYREGHNNPQALYVRAG